MSQLTELPSNLPKPIDDGACDHLVGRSLPSLTLTATDNTEVKLSSVGGRVVIYIYPMTGRPDKALPEGWDEIPGARGCTPQSCSFRDHYSELQAVNTRVFGLSTQSTAYQAEAVSRLHLPFQLLSDSNQEFIDALNLPTMEVDGMVLCKRVTLITIDGVIDKVFYPVFPPNENADQVLSYLRMLA